MSQLRARRRRKVTRDAKASSVASAISPHSLIVGIAPKYPPLMIWKLVPVALAQSKLKPDEPAPWNCGVSRYLTVYGNGVDV